MVLNGYNGYQPPAQRLAAWLVGYVPANGPTVRWGQTPRVGICPPLWVGQPPAAPRSFRQLPVQTGSQRLANPTFTTGEDCHLQLLMLLTLAGARGAKCLS